MAFISLCSLEAPDPYGIESVFWGWSIGNQSGVMSQSGTGTCYREAAARHYIFWIGGDTTTKYQYADCSNGSPIGGWVDSLMGFPIEE